MTGTQLVQVYRHTAQGASTAQVNAMCKNLKMGTLMGKTQACAISTVAWFFGVNRVPQLATRVLQISEWITMWRGFNVDSRRRIRKVWEKKAPTLAKDHRGWNHATGPISATICSVLEAGWKPSTPGFWQAPEASATPDGVLSKRRRVSASGELKMDRALHVGTRIEVEGGKVMTRSSCQVCKVPVPCSCSCSCTCSQLLASCTCTGTCACA